jgi:2'-5' RNA ligase
VVSEGHTVLLVPVPALEPFVRARWEHYDPTWVSADPRFAHGHITLLSPFLAPPLPAAACRGIEEVLRRQPAFEFELRRIATFPNGIVHALPEPDTGFRRLTAELVEAFPQCPPYAGQFPDPVPHLTLDQVHGEVTEASVRAAVAGMLPARGCRAERVQLAWYAPGGCRVLHEWSLS